MVDQIRIYDAGIKSWLQEYTYSEGGSTKSLTVVKASPDKAFAEAYRMMNRAGDSSNAYTSDQQEFVFPIASFMGPMNFIYDPTRSFGRHFWRFLGFKDPGTYSVSYQSYSPLPYNFMYTIDFMCRENTSLNLFSQWLLAEFDHVDYMYRLLDFTSFHSVWSTKKIRFNLESTNNTSELERGEDSKNRLFRLTVDIALEGWIFLTVTEKKNILTTEIGEYLRKGPISIEAASIGTGDGLTRTINTTIANTPIIENSIKIVAYCGTDHITLFDDGEGYITGEGCWGAINYDTGVLSLTFYNAPNAGSDIEIYYDYYTDTLQRTDTYSSRKSPDISSPSDSSSSIDTTPTFDWYDTRGATKYHLQVSTSSDFTSTVINDSTLTSSTFTQPSGLSPDTYYWRVRAYYSNGTWGQWSETFSFTILPTGWGYTWGSSWGFAG